jgi:hypothetical protein
MNFVGSLNEGTYLTNVIVPAIRATLKNLPLGKSTFVSSSERQSSASAGKIWETARRYICNKTQWEKLRTFIYRMLTFIIYGTKGER